MIVTSSHATTMGDPLSITAGVTGTVMFALKSSKLVYELIVGIQDASKELQGVAGDMKAFQGFLLNLQGHLNNNLRSGPDATSCEVLQSPAGAARQLRLRARQPKTGHPEAYQAFE